MKITFQIPEIFVLFSFIFLLKGLYWGGAIILASGLILALGRFSLELQRRKEEDSKQLQIINTVSDSIMTMLSGYKKDQKYH